jgi:gliding motility associated protien GldN
MSILNPYRIVIAGALVLCQFGASAQASKDTSLSKPSDGVNDRWQKSLTPDGAFDRPISNFRQPISWQHIRKDDILWRKRVWREIDTHEKQNIGFRYAGDENTGGGMFIEILIDALKKGKIKGYKGMDDHFSTLMSKEDIMETTAGKPDTSTLTDPITGAETQVISKKDFNPEEITKYRIKEDWIFDRNQGQMVVRIAGLAPVRDQYNEQHVYIGPKVMFWLYYPDIRGLLAQYEVVNPMNDEARYTWDEFFESRQFSSKITKVSNPYGSSNNPGAYGEDFNTHDGNNLMESLYEGKRTAEEIFNKEHDMWVY